MLSVVRFRLCTAALVLAVLPGLLSLSISDGAAAAPRDVTLPTAPAQKRVPLKASTATARARRSQSFTRFDPAGHATLPGAVSAVLTPAAAATRAGSSPVSVRAVHGRASPSRVQVSTADRATAEAAGVHGVLFALHSTAGAGDLRVDVDPATFRNAYGGGFGSRLHLVQLPACVLTTPARPECQTRTPLRALPGATLSAQVAVPSAAAGPTVLAADSDTGGSGGDFAATSLSAGGTWSVGGNKGSFTYSYPISLPAAVGGAAPDISLGYDSSTQDARTEGTNNQSSWLGDGWSLTESFIERTYKGCADVSGSGSPKYDGDQCWAGQILTMSLNGKSTAIVYDDKTHLFHSGSDSSTTKIEDLPDAVNGTANGEHFRVIQDGVQYYFGLNHLPGWAAGDDATNSAWTVPVYHAHGGVADCPDGDFAGTACTLGYRFNLDYVVDAHHNATAYYYSPETGYYGADMKNTAVRYIRGGTLKRIDYGMTASTIYSATAPEQVSFDATAERCLPGRPAGNTCADKQFTKDHPEYWPDTPIDLDCDAGATDCTVHAPSFWSRKRLTSIATSVQVDGKSQPVDRYDFTQSFPDGGDHAPTLWLDSITHTGQDRLGGATADASAGTVSFDPPLQLPNRVGTLPGLPAMYHDRIQTVISETGAETTVAYNTPDCSGVPPSNAQDPADTDVKAFASTNHTACFPVYWTPEAQPAPLVDWFYTHTVKSVTTEDRSNHYQDGTQPRLVTEYTYKGDPGWAYDDNETVKAKNRTWGQFRGYPEVDIRTGDPAVFHYTDGTKVYDRKTLTKTYYFLGLDGDTMPSGHRNVPPLTSQDGTVTVNDDEALAGQVFETDNYTGDGGTVNSAVVNVPKILGPTASRARTGLPALTAQMVLTARTLNRQTVSGGWRRTEKDLFFNTTLGQSTTGMEVQSLDRGEAGATGNVPKCAFTRYLTGSDPTVVVGAEVITTTQDCTGAGATPSGTLLSDVRTSYDGHAFAYDGDGQSSPALPTAGNATQVQNATGADGVTPTGWLVTAVSTYDGYGRTTSSTRTPNSKAPDKSSLAQTVYATFSPATGGLPTRITATTQVTAGVNCATVTTSTKDCQFATTDLDAARQLAVTKTDIDGRVTSYTYDGLGRVTATWLPNKSKPLNARANLKYSYALSATAPTVTTTQTLLDDDSYSVKETLYDSMLRTLETQEDGDNDTTIVSDVQYDSHGWTVITNNAYSVGGAPQAGLISDHVSQVTIPDSTVADHDAMGRLTQSAEEHNGAAVTVTRSAYTGDTTTVLPPTGGVAQTRTVDARGQLTRLDQYTDRPTLTGTITGGFTASGGQSQAIVYGYTPGGKQASVTAADQSQWRYGYDFRGRLTSQHDPDAGDSITSYDDADRVTTTTDARHKQLSYTYDLLGRKLTAVDTSNHNFTLASWAYDTLRIGRPTSSTRYVPGVTGGYTVAVTGYTPLNNPAGTKITLPSSESPLPATWTTKNSYSTNDELLSTHDDPRSPAMLGETITYGYDRLGAPTTTTGIDSYVSGTVHTDFGQPSQVTMGASTNLARAIYSYDEQTLRLTGRSVSRTQAPGPVVDETSWTYDDFGNPLSETDKQWENTNPVTDTQCFRYDGLDRLHEAWTAKDACPAADTGPTDATVSGQAGSYWQTYDYDVVGDRRQVVDHPTTGATATTGYTMGCSTGCTDSGTQPHTLTATTGTNATTFVYDASGNLLTRTPADTSQPGQKLTWDDEGRLAKVEASGATPGTTSYLYDADGNQLIRRDPGRTTFFAGDTEIVVNTSVTPAAVMGAVRTYTNGGVAVAVRSTLAGGGAHYLFGDPHGTSSMAMDTTTQEVTRQQFKPFGEPRITAVPTLWPDPTHGYLGASKDFSTGYTDLGARKYDPALGRFISVDPVLETTDPNQIGGYTYAGDNPVSGADPSGMSGDWCATVTCAENTGGGIGCVDCASGATTVTGGSATDIGGKHGSSGKKNGGCDQTCRLLKKPTPRQPTMSQRCGAISAATPLSVCHKGAFTYADAFAMGSKDTNAWQFACATLMAQDSQTCADKNPFAHNDLVGAAFIVLMFAGAIVCSAACLAAIPEAVLFSVTMDATVLSGGGAFAAADAGAESVLGRFLGVVEEDGAGVGEAEIEDAAESVFCAQECGPVPDPAPQLRANGTPDRDSAVYISVRDADGNVTTVGSRRGGTHAEDAAQARVPGGQMSRPFGWRRDPASGEVTWQPIDVCTTCQPKYPPSLFPPGTTGAPGGAWGG